MNMHLNLAKGFLGNLESTIKTVASSTHKHATDEWKAVLGHLKAEADKALGEIESAAEKVQGSLFHRQDHQMATEVTENVNKHPSLEEQPESEEPAADLAEAEPKDPEDSEAA